MLYLLLTNTLPWLVCGGCGIQNFPPYYGNGEKARIPKVLRTANSDSSHEKTNYDVDVDHSFAPMVYPITGETITKPFFILLCPCSPTAIQRATPTQYQPPLHFISRDEEEERDISKCLYLAVIGHPVRVYVVWLLLSSQRLFGGIRIGHPAREYIASKIGQRRIVGLGLVVQHASQYSTEGGLWPSG